MTPDDTGYRSLVSYCESFLDRHGDCHLGVGWTKSQESAQQRYRVMLEVIQGPAAQGVSLLDFGCGASHLLEYMLRRGLGHIRYSGLDLSEKFLRLSRAKFPQVPYYHADILREPAAVPDFDYVILNGVFNSRCRLSFEEMFAYFRAVVTATFAHARVGIAFNVMSKLVDWERDDLFHLPFDALAGFLAGHVSKRFVIRHDYGLYEYTTYVYR
jgi:SAM-dependent methyltransferase